MLALKLYKYGWIKSSFMHRGKEKEWERVLLIHMYLLIQIESRATNRITWIDVLRLFAEELYGNLNLCSPKSTCECTKVRKKPYERERITSTVGEYGRNVGWYGCLSRVFATAKEYTSSGTVVIATYSRTVHTNAELSIVVCVCVVECELRKA